MAVPSTRRFSFLVQLFLIIVSNVFADENKGVTYDGRSLIVNGKRELFFSGSVHYTRFPPEMWPEILVKARRGGLNVIQTYVFWNIHEPVEGKFNFEGNYDLVKFIRLVQEHGMYVTLRVGPFIQAEWNHGGLPYWLREVPGIIFRSDNEPFKKYMKKYVKLIIDKMQDEKLFASQGGPIILTQIENEYDHIQRAYRARGQSYVLWAGKFAQSLDTGVPWIMCKQKNAPLDVINTCNGRHCGDTFTGPNSPNKPALWTENWTAQYRVFGDPPSQRSAEDISFAVTRFFSKNGCLQNYYMYYGGTNFGRTSAAFTTTRYYDEAPLDEFGLEREPKWSHLRDTHQAINLSKKALLWGTPSVQKIGAYGEIRVYENREEDVCAAFLTNNHTKKATTLNFKGQEYYLPPRSISVLPDCRTVVFNTQMIVSQHNSRNFAKSNADNLKWKRYTEPIPTRKESPPDSKIPLELYTLLKDTSDYGWFTTSLELGPRDLPFKDGILPVIRVTSLGHAMLVFINGEYVGSKHGSHEEKSFVFEKTVNFKIGINTITLLGITVGLPDSGAYMEHRYAGPRAIAVLGLNTGTIDLTIHGWGHKVGLTGEELEVFTKDGSKKVEWTESDGKAPALTWFRTKFDTPEGNQPVAIRMKDMGKGMVWVNGKSIGRYWMSYASPLGTPTQTEYHIPRAFLKAKENFLVVLEEQPSDPSNIEILVVDRDTICTYVTEFHPPHVLTFSRNDNKIETTKKSPKPEGIITCPNSQKIVAVEFSSFGDPYGACGNFIVGTCDAPGSKEVVEKLCIGKTVCTIPVDTEIFNFKGDSCKGIKALAVQVKCD